MYAVPGPTPQRSTVTLPDFWISSRFATLVSSVIGCTLIPVSAMNGLTKTSMPALPTSPPYSATRNSPAWARAVPRNEVSAPTTAADVLAFKRRLRLMDMTITFLLGTKSRRLHQLTRARPYAADPHEMLHFRPAER